VKEAVKLAVIITFRRSNENSAGLQQMLKMLLPRPNALRATAEDVVDSLEFFSVNC
jgi:hypothetical protein